MKTLLTTAFSFTLAFAALSAQASTILLSPTVVSVAPGQTVSLSVSVDPAGATVSTVKAQISYPADLLTPTSFTFGPTWIPLTQSGYDQMSAGTIIKTAGYPAGFGTSKVMGTVTFTARAAGVATISVVQGASIAYNSGNQNTLTGVQGSSQIRIAPTAPVVTPVTQPATQSTVPAVTTPAPAQTEPAATGTTTTPGSQQAAAAAGATIPGAGTVPSWVWVMLAIVILGGGVVAWWFNRPSTP